VFFIKKMRTRVTEGQTDWKKVEEKDVCGGGNCVWKKTGLRGKRNVDERVES
jgi:hypothetical protein